jgi:hypothetical protein
MVGMRGKHTARAVVAAAFLAAALAAPAAAAQDQAAPQPASDREAAREHYETGAAAFEAGDYATALEHLAESYRLFASLRTLYSLGLCQHALGDYGAATRSLEQYLREAGEEAPPDLRARAEQLVAEMRTQMGRIDVRVSVDGAEVLVDGAPVGTSPLAAPVDVGPGWHVVEARREGHETATRRVQAAAGETASVALEPPALPEPPPVPEAPEAPSPGPAQSAAAFYGPPAGVSEQEWFGISDADYREYVFSTGRHQPLSNWILERNREDPDLTYAEIVASTQGPAWLLAGTFVYIFYERDREGQALPWMSFFEWLLGGVVTAGAVVVAIVDALDLGKVDVEHPERLIAVPAGLALPPATLPPETAARAAPRRPPVSASFGIGGLVLRF